MAGKRAGKQKKMAGKQRMASLHVMKISDLNCNLEDNHRPRSEFLMGVIPVTYN